MSDALVPTLMAGAIERSPQSGLPSLPWRDPNRVPRQELTAFIARLEQACLEQPHSADVRTCLGMARAMNFEVYKSMDALEEARSVDPSNFWAQMKYAELHYRLRALKKAEAETEKAIDLAENIWQLGVARRQLQEIKRLKREGARHVDWSKPLTVPALVLAAMLVVVFVTMWK